jgi:hypothetical protein
LRDEWVKDDWAYQSRRLETEAGPVTTRTYIRNWIYESGSVAAAQVTSTYSATYHEGSPARTYVDANERVVAVPASGPSYSCDQPTSASNFTRQDQAIGSSTEPFDGPPSGTRQIETFRRTENGTYNWTERSGATCYAKTQV